MKKVIETITNIMIDPFGAYAISFIGLFFYFFYILNDVWQLALTSSFFFGYFFAYLVVLIGSLLDEVNSL